MPAESWSNVFDATADGPMCPQPNPIESDISEDCLRLNVYTVSNLLKVLHNYNFKTPISIKQHHQNDQY